MNESYNDIYKYVSRKTFFVSLIMICAFFLLCTLTIISVSNKPSDNSPANEYIPVSASVSLYILRNVNGRVAVCDYYDGYELEILDIYVNTLPKEEQAELENGVFITSISQLVSTLEAYTS